MMKLNALGYFMDYCNHKAGSGEITQERYQSGMQEILRSPEERFANCHDVWAVLRELGWK